MLKRFLVARDLDVEKATEMFLNYCKWRRSFVPNGSISASEITHELASNKVFIQGIDRYNRPIAVIYGARHFPSKGGTEELKRNVLINPQYKDVRLGNYCILYSFVHIYLAWYFQVSWCLPLIKCVQGNI